MSLILDLRNNPGGVLQSAVDVSSLFLKDDEIPEGEINPVKLAELELKLGRLPLLIERKKITGESQLIPINELIEEE